MDEVIKFPAVHDQQTESSVESEVITEGYSGEASANVGTIYEAVASADITDQYNEEGEEPLVLLKILMLTQVLILKRLNIRI